MLSLSRGCCAPLRLATLTLACPESLTAWLPRLRYVTGPRLTVDRFRGGASVLYPAFVVDSSGGISTTGGALPIWSRHSRELFFQNPDNRILVMDYEVKNESLGLV